MNFFQPNKRPQALLSAAILGAWATITGFRGLFLIGAHYIGWAAIAVFIAGIFALRFFFLGLKSKEYSLTDNWKKVLQYLQFVVITILLLFFGRVAYLSYPILSRPDIFRSPENILVPNNPIDPAWKATQTKDYRLKLPSYLLKTNSPNTEAWTSTNPKAAVVLRKNVFVEIYSDTIPHISNSSYDLANKVFTKKLPVFLYLKSNFSWDQDVQIGKIQAEQWNGFVIFAKSNTGSPLQTYILWHKLLNDKTLELFISNLTREDAIQIIQSLRIL